MTRAESQAQTRETLVATAADLFLKDGYAATSLEKVADEAGFSKGAVYSNFRNKDELCLAVVDAIRADQAQKLARALENRTTLEEMLAGFERWAEATIGDVGWTTFEVEFSVRSRQDESIRVAVAERNLAIREAVTLLLDEHARAFGITLPMPAADCATALLSLGVGLGVQRAIDPQVGVAVLPSVIRLLAGG
ncbi:TetR/AcrR family transcriptional regulator [Kribbella sandramycini]